MKKIGFICSCLMVGALLWSCTAPAESKANSELRNVAVTPTATVATPETKVVKPASESSELCKQLVEIKKFPGRDPSEQKDPIYAAIIAKGNDIMPCLVEEITNEASMHDPRQAPIWQHYKVGDTAVFLLVHIAKKDELLVQMLTPAYRDEWKTNGVYAYFNYVSKSENRRQLQSWWRVWLEKHRKNSV